MLWVLIRDSLWFIPAIFTLGGSALAMSLAFMQIKHYGLANPSILKKSLLALFVLAELVPAVHCPPLFRQIALLLEEAESVLSSPAGQRELERMTSEFQSLQATLSK